MKNAKRTLSQTFEKDRCDMAKTNKKRVYCLYRVSTRGQVDKNDIPMQKIRCREFVESQGWEIIKEVSELGVSGFKVSAKDRDAIQEIQKDAALEKFDILLVFMFDRLGRREDETPFVVEWFVRNGIEVWSTEEGQQRIENHTDKLMNYIRYWQASGESIKTSIRTKTRLSQIVQEGHFRGGVAPYGYRLEKQGRFNKKGHELNEIVVDEQEAAVVQLIFDKYVNEGFGAQRLISFLIEKGIYTRKGTNFTNTTLIKMVKNIAYTGVLRSGDAQSEVIPELQIISADQYNRAQEICASRANVLSNIPLNTRSQVLINGLAYCSHCGSKLVLSTNGSTKYTKRQIRYICHNRVRHPQDCDGQAGYASSIIDPLVNKVLVKLFESIKASPRDDVIQAQYEEQVRLSNAVLKQSIEKHTEKENDLELYKAEVKNVITGNSKFSMEILNELINETKEEIKKLDEVIKNTKADIEGYGQLRKQVAKRYNDVMTWADMFDECSMEAKKMVVSQLFNKVRIGKDYTIEIDMNVSYDMFHSGINDTPLKAEVKANGVAVA